MAPIKAPKFPIVGLQAADAFGELSVIGTSPGAVLHPRGSAGVWGIAGTTEEVKAAKAAGPMQTAGIVAHGGSKVSAFAADMDAANTNGSVGYFFGQGSQAGVTGTTDNGNGVVGVSGTGGIAVLGKTSGGWAGQFHGDVLVTHNFVVYGTAELGNTMVRNLNVLGTLTMNGQQISDVADQVAALQNQVNSLMGLPAQVSTLQSQIATLQKGVSGLSSLSTDIFALKGQINNLQNEINSLQTQINNLQSEIEG